MQKDFEDWHLLKAKLDIKEKLPSFKQREIWWCHLGLNIGSEENGKHEHYHRPILIVRKFNNHLFLGVPLTTKIKDIPYYHKINLKEKVQCAMLLQMRVIDGKRLDRIIGKIGQEQFNNLREKMKELI